MNIDVLTGNVLDHKDIQYFYRGIIIVSESNNLQKMAVYCRNITSPIGFLKMISDDRKLKSIHFVDECSDNETNDIEILNIAESQLIEYFAGHRLKFDLELDPEGTLFQKRVWEAVAAVSYGETRNYGDIAKELGSLNFSRAVGMANGKNPLPIIIPCHRIIGNDGKLTGYSGGLEKKKWLLVHEQKYSGNSLFL